MTVIPTALVFILAVALIVVWASWRQRRYEAFIRETLLPPGLLDELCEPFPHLGLKERQLVARGLRKFMLARLKSGNRPVAMPSRAVEALWLAFSRRKAAYAHYSKQATGSVLPVTAVVALGSDAESNAALRRCWWHCCREETIDPRRPSRVPLLFALDAKLKITDGHYYFTGALARQRWVAQEEYVENIEWLLDPERSWSAEDLQDPSIDGTTDGFGNEGSGDSGGDGGGD